MRLKDCIPEDMSNYGFISAPVVIRKPDSDWVKLKDNKIIPESFYRFYCNADYFSLDKIPKFLNDGNKILFPYLEYLTDGLALHFREAHELIKELKNILKEEYTPLKKIKGEKWDVAASLKSKRTFKYFIIALSALLDIFAEIVTLILIEQNKKVTVGKTSIKSLLSSMKKQSNSESQIITLREELIKRFCDEVIVEFEGKDNEKDWFELFSLYRNKITHFSTNMYPRMSLHDKNGNFYDFLPNHWPYITESYINFHFENKKKTHEPIEQFFYEKFIHQDIVEYSEGLYKKIFRIIDKGFEILCIAYLKFKDYDLFEDALNGLNKNSKKFNFKYFNE